MIFSITTVAGPHSQCVQPFEDFLTNALPELGHGKVHWHSDRFDFTIVLNAHRAPRAWLEQCRKRLVIVYNTEVESTWSDDYRKLMNCAHAVWQYSSEYVLDNHHYYVPLWLPMQRSGLPSPSNRPIRMGFYGSINARRARVLKALYIRPLDFGTYGYKLDEYLINCQAILSPQFYDGGPVCHARIMQALSFGCQVLSEDGADSKDFHGSLNGAVFAGYDDLITRAELLMSAENSPTLATTEHLRQSRLDKLALAISKL